MVWTLNWACGATGTSQYSYTATSTQLQIVRPRSGGTEIQTYVNQTGSAGSVGSGGGGGSGAGGAGAGGAGAGGSGAHARITTVRTAVAKLDGSPCTQPSPGRLWPQPRRPRSERRAANSWLAFEVPVLSLVLNRSPPSAN